MVVSFPSLFQLQVAALKFFLGHDEGEEGESESEDVSVYEKKSMMDLYLDLRKWSVVNVKRKRKGGDEGVTYITS